MRMMNGEVELNVPANKAWQIYRSNEMISKVNPHLLAHAEYLEGDGRPGSIRLFKLGAGVSKYVSESKEKIEVVEENGNAMQTTYRVVEGELKMMYDPYRVTFAFKPTEDAKCIAGWSAEYQPIAPNIPPPESAKHAALQFMKAIESFYLSSLPKHG